MFGCIDCALVVDEELCGGGGDGFGGCSIEDVAVLSSI